VLRKFMRMEAAGGGGALPAAGDSPLSTHPAAANRLRRLRQAYGGGSLPLV
jgi:Zn-dependent protease with chaperone function